MGGRLLWVAEIQQRFLLAAERRDMLPAPVPATFEDRRDSLLDRFPGFRETLMAWPAPLDAPLSDLDGDFTAAHMGRRHEAYLGRSARQHQGSFYTARPMIRGLLEAPLRHPRPRLLDPAMGCGAFLSEALAMRAPETPEARWEFACASLFGVDRDPLAREIALLALWLQAGHPDGDPRLLGRNLRTGNSLLPPELAPGGALGEGIDWVRDFPEPMREGGFTAVVGNPPFINVERLGPEEKESYRAAFPDLQKRFDLFVPMAAKALELTRPGGHLGLVLPQAFLTQAYAERLRRRFLAETTLLGLEEAAFPGASVRTVLVTALKTPPAAGHRIRLAGPQESLPQAPLGQLPEARIPAQGGTPFAIAMTAFERGIPLGEVAFATWGVRGVPITEFHRDDADHPTCRPMIKGDGIEPYRVNWAGKFLRYEPARLYRPLFPELFEGEKIVLRKVSGSRGLVAALDREGYYTDDSVLCCQLRRQLSDLPESLARRYGGAARSAEREGYDLSILLAVLNSRIGGLVFTMLLGNGLNVYPAAVMRMPLPPFDAERFEAIRTLVSCRQTAESAEGEELDRQVEQHLAALYGIAAMSLA